MFKKLNVRHRKPILLVNMYLLIHFSILPIIANPIFNSLQCATSSLPHITAEPGDFQKYYDSSVKIQWHSRYELVKAKRLG